MPKNNSFKMIDLDVDLLKSILKKQGLSQTELAKRVSCNRKTIERAMREKRISKTLLYDIANQLNINPRRLSPSRLAGGYDDLFNSIFRFFELNILEFENAPYQLKTEFVSKTVSELCSILKKAFPNALYDDNNDWESTYWRATSDVETYCDCVEKRAQLLKNLPYDKTAEEIRKMKDYEIYELYLMNDSSDFDEEASKFPSPLEHPELYREVTPRSCVDIED